eukprot:gene11564-13437_t
MASTGSGLLHCQRDAYALEGVSKVVACIKSESPDSSTYHVTLEDSVFYPEGGGQPWDLGSVNGIDVEKVVKGPGSNKEIVVDLKQPVEVGAEVVCKVDWNRRYDFMQQHTAQHLFSAVADKLFKAETTGWALGTEYVSVDLSTAPSFLTASQIEDIETETNRMIASGSAVNWKIYSKDQIVNHDPTNADSNSPAELNLLRGGPKGAALELDELRMVHIDGLDLNPCGGTHLRGLSEINLLKVMGFEKDAGRGCVRVRFVAGQRALNYFKESLQRESCLSSHLSVPPVQHVSMVEKLLKDKRDTAKRLDIYSEELAELYAISLVATPERALDHTAESAPVTPVYAYHRPGADLTFLVKAATTVLALHQKAHPDSPSVPLVYLSGDSNMPVFVSSLDPPKAAKPVKKNAKAIASDATPSAAAVETGLSGAFVLFGSDALVQTLKEPLVQVVNGKGGGRPGRLQGTAVSLENLEEVRKLLLASVA